MARLTLLLALAACDLARMQAQPRCELDGTLDGEPCDLPPPPDIVAWGDTAVPPPAVTRALVARGRDRYDRFCAACHGLAGDSDSEVARSARRPIPSLLSPVVRALNDERVVAAVAVGVGDMPRQPLDAADRWAVVHYVRVLQQRDVPLDSVRGEVPWR